MSAGQANLPQRNKMMGQNQSGAPSGETDDQTVVRNNNYLNAMLDGYSANNPTKKVSKKKRLDICNLKHSLLNQIVVFTLCDNTQVQRGGTRGVPTGSNA